ncbi:MAG TPA: hypothetical protein VGM03_24805 [Phycisphaerae bacterium]
MNQLRRRGLRVYVNLPALIVAVNRDDEFTRGWQEDGFVENQNAAPGLGDRNGAPVYMQANSYVG